MLSSDIHYSIPARSKRAVEKKQFRICKYLRSGLIELKIKSIFNFSKLLIQLSLPFLLPV